MSSHSSPSFFMGNASSDAHEPAGVTTAAALQEAFVLLHDPQVDAGGRRQAFNMLQKEYAPNLKGTPEYAAALAALFQQRFEPWAPADTLNGGDEGSAADADDERSRRSCLSDDVIADRIRGCIFGCALGDAVGLATEFMSSAEVRLKYGDDESRFFPGAEVFPDTHRMVFPAGTFGVMLHQMWGVFALK